MEDWKENLPHLLLHSGQWHSFISWDEQAIVAKADTRTVEVEEKYSPQSLVYMNSVAPKTSTVVNDIRYNSSEKKLNQSNERIKQVRNSCSLMKELFQLPWKLMYKAR